MSLIYRKANTALVWSETNRLIAEWFADIQARKAEDNGEYRVLDLNPEMIQVSYACYRSVFGNVD
jgi:hypothetical protein